MSPRPSSILLMEARNADPPGEPEPAPPYAELARRLLTEHAELFRLSPLAISRPRGPWRPERPSRPPVARRRNPQLMLPLRPRVLDGGEAGTRP
ncbi:MAG: hypothetical protein JOZ75_11920 [Candidatus Dormibacteraeota bacterium]|nr:hypothetical protein [Candidatus Dormibacteraeota bacterium]